MRRMLGAAVAILESGGLRGHYPSEARVSRSSVPPETRVLHVGKERRDLNPQVYLPPDPPPPASESGDLNATR